MTAGLRIAEAARGAAVTLDVDGNAVPAFEGESVATALLAAGIRLLRRGPHGGGRGLFCAMGVCQECVIEIDGAMQPACQAPVRDGLRVSLGS